MIILRDRNSLPIGTVLVTVITFLGWRERGVIHAPHVACVVEAHAIEIHSALSTSASIVG